MNIKKIIFIAVLVVIILTIAYLYYSRLNIKTNNVLSVSLFEECVSAGNPIQETFPERCMTPDGQVFVNLTQQEQTDINLPDGPIEIDLEKSKVSWEAKKKLNPNWIDRGEIKIKSADIEIKQGQLFESSIVFDMNSILADQTGSGSGQDRLSSHLKSKDFFDVENYPESKFEINEVIETNGVYIARGDLTIKNIKQPIEIPFVLKKDQTGSYIEGQVAIDRTKFDIRFGSDSFFDNLGNNIIEDNFYLSFRVFAKTQIN